jgi:hypothetical protein
VPPAIKFVRYANAQATFEKYLPQRKAEECAESAQDDLRFNLETSQPEQSVDLPLD